MKKYKIPILLIAFKRPNHTRKVLAEIRKQQPQELYIFQDGARENNERDITQHAEVRSIFENEIDWHCNLHTYYSDKNLGCGQGPATAITWFFENVEMGMILEDDAVPSQDFFEYVATLLEKYKSDESVKVIGSMKIFEPNFGVGSYYFSQMNRNLCAWATWERSWKGFDYRLFSISRKRMNRTLKKYKCTLREREYWCDRLAEIHKDALGDTSWDTQFLMSIWLNYGKGICPNANLSSNIGCDKDGTHTTDENFIIANMDTEPILPIVHPTTTNIYRKADLLYHKTYYAPYDYKYDFVSLFCRCNKRLKRILNHKGPWIKRK